MVLKSVIATEILLEARLFKIIDMIILEVFEFFIMTYLFIIFFLFLCGMKIVTDDFEKCESY